MIKVREIEDTDIIPLSEILIIGFPYTTKEFWVHQFEFWWTLNPAYIDKIPRGWVLEKDTALVGFIGNIPVNFQIRGTVKPAFASNSWYVLPSYRGTYSFSLLNEFIKQKNASLFLFKTDDDDIMNIMNKYKFKEIIIPPSQKEYVYILNKKRVYTVFLKFLFSKRKIPNLTDLFELNKRLGMLIFAYLYQKPLNQRGVISDETYISSLCNLCDDTFYKLIETSAKNCDVSLSHDTKTLNWLYFSSSRFSRRIVIQCHRSYDRTLVGYMVFDFIRFKMADVENMQLVDICIENNDPKILASLTSFAIEIGKQNNAALLIVYENTRKTDLYFHNTFTMSRSNQEYRYLKFSDTEISSGIDNRVNICLPILYPPQ